jgi:anthranilate synthase component II
LTEDRKKKALIIDHDDSFIWNIKSWLSEKFEVSVINHCELTKFYPPTNLYDLIVLSPGPKSPSDYPLSLNYLQKSPAEQPLLGICLGWQMMVQQEKGHVQTYLPVLHGKTSKLISLNPEIHGLTVARYHSLTTVPTNDFKILATSDQDQLVMWGQHQLKKWMGFQFHPESFLTEKKSYFLQQVELWMNQ